MYIRLILYILLVCPQHLKTKERYLCILGYFIYTAGLSTVPEDKGEVSLYIRLILYTLLVCPQYLKTKERYLCILGYFIYTAGLSTAPVDKGEVSLYKYWVILYTAGLSTAPAVKGEVSLYIRLSLLLVCPQHLQSKERYLCILGYLYIHCWSVHST